jgi:hypothetical protein
VTHPIAVGAGVLVAVLILTELLAVPVATRVVGDALGRCVVHRSLTIEEIGRPVVPRLLLGRARDVVLRVEDAELEGVRVAEAVIEVPRVVLPWAPGDPPPSPASVHLRIEEDAVAERLAELAPLGFRPSVELEDGVARVGIPTLRLEAAVTLSVGTDGTILVEPGAGPTGWWERLGLSRQIRLPNDVRVDAVAIADAALTATLRLEELPGGDGEGCDEPIAADGPVVAEPARRAAGGRPETSG